MSPRATSLNELAAIAGVTAGTVSKALSGKGNLSAETRERIRALADQHGFRLNRIAQSLKRGRAGAIAVVLPLGHESAQSISDPFFIALIGHLADAISARGQDLILSKILPTGPDWLSDITRSGRADGLIIVGQSDQHERLNAVARQFMPLVVWGERQQEQAYCSVGSDNWLGGRLATGHLIAQGRRRIAFFGMADIPEIAARHAGYLDALGEAGLKPAVHIEAHLTPDASYAAITRYLRQGALPDAIVAASDVIAMSAMRALAEMGIAVPDDVAVTGYDDVSLAAYVMPPLTTVRQDLAEAGHQLVDLLFRRIAGEDTRSVVLPPRLIVRGST